MDKHMKHVVNKEQDSIFQPIAEAVSRTMNLPVSIWIPDEQRQALRIAAAVGLPPRYVRKAVLALNDTSFTGEVFKSGEVKIAGDVLSDPRWKYKDTARKAGWKSVLGVPIKAHGTVLGIISIYTFVTRDFSDLEKQLLADYAAQIGLAIEAESRRKTLARLLDISYEFDRLLTEQPKDVLRQIVNGACEVTGADCVVIYPYDTAREKFYDIKNVAAYGLTKPLHLKDKPRREKGMAAYVKRQGEVVISNIEREDPDMSASPFIKREGIKAFMGIALRVADRVVGILYVNFRTPHCFGNEEKDTIRLFAHQAAIAIDNSRLYQQVSTRAEALKKLHEVGPTLVSIPGTSESLKTILRRIVQNAQGVLGADLVDLYLYIQRRDEYVIPPFQVGKRLDPSVRKDKIYADDVVCAIVEDRQPQYFPEAQLEPTLTQSYTVIRPDVPSKRFVIREEIKSTEAVPLIVGTEVVGILFANYRSPQTFPQQQRELIELFANQAAIAIRNTRLFEQHRALQDIARDITSILDKDELLQKILARSLELLGCEIGSIALLNKATNQLEFQYAVGKKRYLSIPFGRGLIGTAAATRKPVRVGDVTKDSRHIKHVAETRSELDVPMLIGEELVGVLNAESTRYNAFDENSEELAVILAGQAAIALENARLYQETERLYKEAQGEAIAAKQLATLGTAMAALQHRINNTFNIIVPNLMRLRKRIDTADKTVMEILDIIERNARYTSDIIARIQEPLREIEPQNVDVNAVISDIVGRVEEQWQADPARPKIEVTLRLDDSIPQIRAPIEQITEVFRNLIDNAYRAMRNGGKLLVTSRLTDDTIYVRVQDTGPGIPLQVQQRLFIKPVPSKEPGGGAGLGLWLSQLMLQSIGGAIMVEKSGSTGTTMLVRIPVLGTGGVRV